MLLAAPLLLASSDPRLANSYRQDKNGWIFVHLEGTPNQIGFQHGYHLAPEIDDCLRMFAFYFEKGTPHKDWNFFREAAERIFWPKIDREYQEEIQGIAEGLAARGYKWDKIDVTVLNANIELASYYVPWLANKMKQDSMNNQAPGKCSAFIATGSYTRDGKIVIAHNNWTNYMNGERWRIIFDIHPTHGYSILMDGFPGVIASDDDFGINSDGLMVTETTITQFEGWDPKGQPEFMRARKALQYAGSIDEYTRIMLDGNNGGYANDWLLGDRKTGEIAQLELGLKAYKLWRTKDGVFAGSNFARDPKVLKLDTPEFEPNNMESSPNARRARWDELLNENKGKIDVDVAQQMLGDHVDSFEKKPEANERVLCGHLDTSARGVKEWAWGAYYPGGAVQGKATDSSMTRDMQLVARMGHPCGADFHAEEFLTAHPEYAWQKPYLHDMNAGPWTRFRAAEKPVAAN